MSRSTRQASRRSARSKGGSKRGTKTAPSLLQRAVGLSDAGTRPARPSVLWKGRSASTKTLFSGAMRHSRFVRVMKVVLPIAAFAIVAGLALFGASYKADDELTVTFTQSPKLKEDRRMVAPVFTGTTARGQPFEVTADSAQRQEANPDQVLLDTLKASLGLTEVSGVLITADKGLLDLDKQTMQVMGDIIARTDDGYVFHTEKVFIDIDRQAARGDMPIKGHGPAGELEAARFELQEGGEILRFEGGVTLTIKPDALERDREQASSATEAPLTRVAEHGR